MKKCTSVSSHGISLLTTITTCSPDTRERVGRGEGKKANMKLKQRVVLLAILLVIFIFTKVFLIDNLDSSAANREDQRAFHRMMAGLRVELAPKLDHTLQSPWEIAAQWVVPREVYPEETPELGAIMHAMATKKVIKADVGYKGTQLKALLILEGGQKVVFKPKR